MLNQDFIDYLKHLTTLSTGSILIVIALMDKVFTQPKWRPLIILSILAFLTSVLASLLLYTYALVKSGKAETKLGELPQGVNLLMLAQLSFVVGLYCLAAFALRNLY